MDDSASAASNHDTSRKTAQSNRTAPGAGQEDMYLQGALLNSRATGHIRKDMNFRRTARAMTPARKSGKSHKTSDSSHTRTTDIYTVLAIIKLMIVP